MENNTNQKEDDLSLRPICFVIMPYGRKPTFAKEGPAFIDYNALWDKAFCQFIEDDLGYHAIRADQDLGAMIIKEMIERLALADLVIADVSTPNANVYYEIGIRHAAKATGCVLIASDWSEQKFDISQMRQVRYPLPEGDISDETALAVRKTLNSLLTPLINGVSPVYESIPGFPGKADIARSSSFQKQVQELLKFSTEVRTIRLLNKNQRAEPTRKLKAKYQGAAASLPAIALELIYLLRDNTDWKEGLDFIESLPDHLRNLNIIKEQRSLALSKTGNHREAIAALQELIAISGDTSERRGLLGGRYKKLYRETGDMQDLNKAISEYEKGMMLDLNDYYPSCNLPGLLRTRNRKGDEAKARVAATVTVVACERARALNPSDEWLLPTLLVAAFEAEDVDTATRLYEEMSATGVQPFHLEAAVPDLVRAIGFVKDEEISSQLSDILSEIKNLMGE